MAQGAWGGSFVEDPAELTGADVAASTDLTGAASLGGDWQLEYSTGVIDVSTVLDASSAAFFDGVLQMVPGNGLGNTSGLFSIRTDRIVVTPLNGGAEVDEVVFDDVNEALDLVGSTSADTFRFTGIPGLGATLAASTLNGNGGLNTIDVSAINKNFVFEINNSMPGPTTISSRSSRHTTATNWSVRHPLSARFSIVMPMTQRSICRALRMTSLLA